VQKSLAYDLFGIASSHVVDQAAVRAADIAQRLHEDEDSPYFGLVKYSGVDTGRGRKARAGIALSTIVNALKPLVAEKGVFENMGIRDLKKQTTVVDTFFSVIQEWYGDDWLDRNNAFMHAAGFTGAVEFLKTNLVPYCNGRRSYTFATIKGALKLRPNKRIYRSQLARMQGRASARKVTELLFDEFKPAKVQESALEF
jgi:hypothetical protein